MCTGIKDRLRFIPNLPIKISLAMQLPLNFPKTGSDWINLPYYLKNPVAANLVPKVYQSNVNQMTFSLKNIFFSLLHKFEKNQKNPRKTCLRSSLSDKRTKYMSTVIKFKFCSMQIKIQKLTCAKKILDQL